LLLLLCLHEKELQVFGHVLEHGLEELLELGLVVFIDQRLHERFGHVLEHPPVDLLALVLDLFLEVSDLEEDLVDLLAQCVVFLLDLLVLLLRETPFLDHVLELEHGGRFAVDDRHQFGPLVLSNLQIDQGEPGVFDPLFEIDEEVARLLLVGFHDLFLAADVVLALENPGDFRLEAFGQVVEVLLELAALPRLEPEQDRLLRVLEIVYVAQVVRDLPRPGRFLEHRLDRGHSPRTRLACDEDVVPRIDHAHAEAQGLDSAVLTDDALQGLYVAGRLERQAQRVQGPAEHVDAYLE
jgi:hypothetical protein